jgi:hypothetical protein
LTHHQKKYANAEADEASGASAFFGNEANKTRDNDEQGPPPVKEHIKIKQTRSAATQDDAESNEHDPTYYTFHYFSPFSVFKYSINPALSFIMLTL